MPDVSPASSPAASAWAAQSVRRRSPAATQATPLFGQVVQSGNDSTRFGAKTKSSSTDEPKKTHYGYIQNNLREGARIAFCDIAPLVLSCSIIGGPVTAFTLGVGGSIVSGKIGRHLSKNVDPENLNPAFKYVSTVRSAILGQGDGEPVDLINRATDDLLNLRGAGFMKDRLSFLKLSKDSGMGKLLTRFSGFRAEVNMRAANARTKKEVGKAVVDGTKDYAIFSILNKVGTAMIQAGKGSALLRPIGWLGHLVKNAAWVKMAADVAISGKEKEDGKHA